VFINQLFLVQYDYQSWDNADRITTEEDVRLKREQAADLEEQAASLREQLDAALERNTKLVVFRQASSMAMKKFREKEDEVYFMYICVLPMYA